MKVQPGLTGTERSVATHLVHGAENSRKNVCSYAWTQEFWTNAEAQNARLRRLFIRSGRSFKWTIAKRWSQIFHCRSAHMQFSTHHDIMALHLRLFTRQLVTFKLQTEKKREKGSDMFIQMVFLSLTSGDSLPLTCGATIIPCIMSLISPLPYSSHRQLSASWLAPPSSPFYPTPSASSLLLAGPDRPNTGEGLWLKQGWTRSELQPKNLLSESETRQWSEMSKHGVASQFPQRPRPGDSH